MEHWRGVYSVFDLYSSEVQRHHSEQKAEVKRVKGHDFRYISKRETEVVEVREKLVDLIREVQQKLRGTYTFQFKIVGSYERNMITYDGNGNAGFDLDVNIWPNDKEERFSPKELKLKFKEALDSFGTKYGFSPAEDSTRVLTIKVKDRRHAQILYSVDFAFVKNYTGRDGREHQQIIRYRKNQGSYVWEEQGDRGTDLREKEVWLKKNIRLWEEMRNRYLEKKNQNQDENLHSRSIYAQAVHEICQRYGYYQS